MFDVVVIGSGPAGYVAAIRASQLGLNTAVIEKDKLGGICLNWGCIPSKSLLKNAELVNQIKDSDKWGISFDNVSFDFAKAISRSRDVSKQLTQGIEYLVKKNKITLFKDTASLSGDNSIKLLNSGESISSKNVIIATGARPRNLPNLEIDGEMIISSREALELKKLPKSIGIIGAGAIGVEFAYFFNALGTRVTLLEAKENILPNEDIEVSQWMHKVLKRKK